MRRRYRPSSPQPGNFDQNDGVAGVVYILRNEAFKESWLKIGQSRHSGHVRANDMNRAASTGLPAHHICVYECRTLDCGNAEKAVFRELSQYRKGRQEFFEIDIDLARRTIARVCQEIDTAVVAARYRQQQATREAEAERLAAAKRANEAFLREAEKKRQKEAVEERRRRDAAEWERQRAEAEKLHKIRKEREESDRLAALPAFDLTCPSCSIVLTVPGSAAERPTQRLRCKSCLAVFQANGKIISQPPAPAEHTREFQPQFAQENVPRRAKPFSLWKTDIVANLAAVGCVVILIVAWNNRAPQTAATSATHRNPPTSELQVQAKTQQQQLDEAAAEISAKYPHLNSQAGEKAIDLIVQRRDALIAAGLEPAAALRQAADEIALGQRR